jgi:HEAT repeat protein
MSHRQVERDSQGRRTAADVGALLLELERGLKAFLYYPQGSAEREDHIDRCFRAWSDDLARFGPLRLEVRGATFWFGEPGNPVGPGRCEELARDFAMRSLWVLCFEPDLEIESLAAFLAYLGLEPSDLDVGEPLSASAHPGIRISDTASESPVEIPVAEPSASGGAEDTARDIDYENIDPETTLTGLASPPEPEPSAPPAGADTAVPGLEIDTLLEDLEECDDDNTYRDLGFELVTLAARRAENGFSEEGYSVLLCFARHASDDQKRSVEQRYVAEQSVNRLCEGPLLELLIERAAASKADTAVRASEALLVLGAPAVGALLERLCAERDRVARDRLSGVVLAMGEEAATALLVELESQDATRRKVALRLAGETQNPKLVPALRKLFLRGGSELSGEAAKALMQIGDVAAYEALVDGLKSPRPDVVQLATYSLGRTGRGIVVAPLVAVLERALRIDALDLAREVVRSLGRLGHLDAIPPLCEILNRGGFFSRRRLRELKLAVIGSLRALPGPDAEAGLRAAMGQRDRVLRGAARSALLHRGSRPG